MRSQNVMTGSMAILQYFLIMPAGRQGAAQGIHHFTGGSFPFISLILTRPYFIGAFPLSVQYLFIANQPPGGGLQPPLAQRL